MTATMASSLVLVGILSIILALLRLRHVSLQNLVLGLIGTITGLLLGALVSVPLSRLPGSVGGILPLVVSVTLAIGMVWVTLSRRRQLLALMPWLLMDESTRSEGAEAAVSGLLPRILVDTSAIIDGRIADIAAAGFMPGRLVVPRFVLAELQNIADSEDAMRRSRGRRGLEVLGRLRDQPEVTVEVITDDVPGIREVDAKLVSLAQRFGCNVLTTDYNLNQVAGIQGVRVLNVNELSNAIRPVVIPGEELRVRIVQPGKERNQGVGYLTDGTMIVVENGDKLIGQEVATEVTRVFQTVAGKMIFAAPKGTVLPADAPAPAAVQPITPEDAVLKAVEDAANAAPANASSTAQSQPRKRHRYNRGRHNSGHTDAGN